jgi:hypothetical protein
MGKNLPVPPRSQTTTMPSIADMESRQQKPSRPQVPISVVSQPVTPAEALKNPTQNIAPPEVNVTTGFPGMTAANAKEPNPTEEAGE